MKHLLLIIIAISFVFSYDSTEQRLSGEWIYIKSIPAKSDSSTTRVETIKDYHLIEFLINENKKDVHMCHTGKHISPDRCKKDWYKLKVENNQIRILWGDDLLFSKFMTFEFQGDTLALETWMVSGIQLHPIAIYKDLYIRTLKSNGK